MVAGCQSPTKRQYLNHLSLRVEPAPYDSPAVTAFAEVRGTRASSVATAEK